MCSPKQQSHSMLNDLMVLARVMVYLNDLILRRTCSDASASSGEMTTVKQLPLATGGSCNAQGSDGRTIQPCEAA